MPGTLSSIAFARWVTRQALTSIRRPVSSSEGPGVSALGPGGMTIFNGIREATCHYCNVPLFFPVTYRNGGAMHKHCAESHDWGYAKNREAWSAWDPVRETWALEYQPTEAVTARQAEAPGSPDRPHPDGKAANRQA